MIALILALVASDPVVENMAARLYVVAACQRYMSNEDRGSLDTTQYPQYIRSYLKVAIDMGEEEQLQWNRTRCESAVSKINKEPGK